MRDALPARHVMRRFVLFVLTVVFFLTLSRAALGLWQFERLVAIDSLSVVFLTGLRFDLALCALLLLVPVTIGTILGLFTATAAAGRALITLVLVSGLFLVVGAELVTPVFVAENGLRPDLQALLELEQPVALVQEYGSAYPVPLALGSVLCLLLLFAFIVRLDPSRLLHCRLERLSGVILWSGSTLVCLFALASGPHPMQPWLSVSDSVISQDAVVNDLALNSLYKLLNSLAQTL